MNPADNLQSTSIEQQLEQALQELRVSHEERGHLLIALERASEEQDAMDEELEKKDQLIQEREKELEDIKRLLSETQQMWMDERASFEQKLQGATGDEAQNQESPNNDENSPIHQQLQQYYQKSNERWTKMEEHIAKASGRLLSLQQRFSQLKQPLDGVLKVMQKVQLQGRKIVDGQQQILNGEHTK